MDEKELEQRAPGFWISLLPMVVTFVLINGFGVELLYGLTAGCVLSLLFFCKSLGGIKGFGEIVSEGFNNGIFPCIIIAAVVGVGKVVSATDVFALVQENKMCIRDRHSAWRSGCPSGGRRSARRGCSPA